ncbi:polypeptide N-acetylgalactosaminyltransferase 9 [Oncorhynchus nerka]|uniref:Polypeptide N-acetylgalactosaminyltransferase n=4 Tax=Oncorhynchus TaxID=8016 RepID=A0A8C7J440_ONCKI|nr:polypeptide N-acetylgalactosaminyltransferase 9 [Oncorhynchus kisutch]XP_021461965.1 polypeptide N-acetylgalactosaminyltransferase 9 isoform X1 [Oncorhynchus mykiss]XP_029493979.1 polypeptide N-acetylgalactosaminyltransferase 9 [Oncorhynchus nerka]XP_035641878.2 polypeptide N-acetylgalactosaminyltransferase 9 isoform X1 [Oncorhynchus keta]XP_046203000.1 polypeptide N-acetylgalactosaminyltransferase 9 [Oncorhynchus gorbuscha]
MAVARKIKTLLTVNIFVFVGIILFSVYCRIQDRSEELIQIGRISDQRLRTRNGKVSNLVDRQSILQRLERLEDVVYNQLNGLAKPMGLVEGPGGLGQGGAAATLGDDSHVDGEGKYEEYGYNAQLSDRISLDRSIPDYRPKKCKQLTYPEDLPQISVVFIFVNEALSVILRSVHSVVNHTPAHLLKEIILVDDNSDSVELKFNLDQYVNKRYPGLVKIVRNSKREGLIRARIHGWNAATAPVVGFFDAHVEFNTAWAEPILTRVKEDHTRIILPAIDNIKFNTFEVQQYANAAHGYNWGLWCMYIIPPQEWLDKGDETAPIRTPAMIGCSFVVDREYFGQIGLLDPGMEVYGGENIELGMRVWQCGGSMEVLPCARVAHIERTKKPYNNDIDYYAKRNALRAAEVWMDEYKSHVYMAWNIPMNNPGVDYGDVSERVALRKRLQCRSFRWYLENVYPEMRIYNNTITYGEVRNSKASGYCLDQGSEDDDKAILYPCHGMSSQLARYSTEGLLQLGPLGSTTFLPNTKCLIDDGRGRTPSLKKCDSVSRVSQRLWDFTQNGPIISRDTGRCLEVEMSKDANFGLRLVVQRCSGQKWVIRNWIKHPRH